MTATCSGCGRVEDLHEGGLPVGWEWTLAGEVIRDYGTFENWLRKQPTDRESVVFGFQVPKRPYCLVCIRDDGAEDNDRPVKGAKK